MALKPIHEVAESLGIPEGSWIPYGRSIAKVDPAAESRQAGRSNGRIVLVTGMTPGHEGVGKTVTTLGLVEGLTRRGIRAIALLRQPSLGPVFGIKGGGAGGGRATVEPQDEVNLGLTGDIDAVTNAHNLLAALIDNHLHHGNPLGIDPATIAWPRALDVEDRALRDIEVGAGPGNGPVRRSSFVVTAASEIMAILGLARDAADLKSRLERIRVGLDRTGRVVRAGDLSAGGSMAAILRRARWPNLLQTSEGSPVLVHGGPFGNLSYGTTTLASIELARRLADVVVIEAGFGSDLGGEKFVDIVAPQTGAFPSAAVLVSSLPALHGHAPGAVGVGSLDAGLENLDQHIRNLRSFGMDPVIALNRFANDDPREIAMVRSFCAGVSVAIEEGTGFLNGGAGMEGVAEATLTALSRGQTVRPIVSGAQPLPEQVDTIVRTCYAGDGVDLSPEARRELEDPSALETDHGPVCVAKTPLSLSDDPHRLGRPRGYRVHVRRWVPASGAGYTVALLGEIQTMPGLPTDPRATRITVDEHGEPIGAT